MDIKSIHILGKESAMKTLFLTFGCLFLSYSLLADEVGYTLGGVDYGELGVKAYSSSRHGPDGAIFLDPFLDDVMLHFDGKKVLDTGCGAAPWAIVAAKNGASVWGIDIQKKMIDQAEIAVVSSGMTEKVTLMQGDVAALPFEKDFFDAALSINVSCSLPDTSSISLGGTIKHFGLGPHLQEMARVLKEEGIVLLTAPTSFGVVFSNGAGTEEEVKMHISTVLAHIGSSKDPEVIVKYLSELVEINRATFVHREDQLVLITDEKQLKTGEPIWRKIPGLVIPSHYHSEEDYVAAFKEVGFNVEKIYRPCFKDEGEWQRYLDAHPTKNERLSQAYIQHPPFVIYLLKKKK